jgi:hypothetical protein
MEVLLIVAGVLGVYFFIESQKKSAATAAATQTAVASIGASSGSAPTAYTAQTAVADTALDSMALGSGISVATGVAQTLNESVAAAGAIPIVGAAVSAVAQVLLAQHTARLKGAIAENQLIPTTVEAFDADMAEAAAAYNAGTATKAQVIAALQAIDAQVHAYMKSNATGPGRAWNDSPPMTNGQTPCNKTCTAECCVYWNDLRPAIYGAGVFDNGTTGAISAINGQSKSGISTTGGATCPTCCYVPEVYPPVGNSAYGTYSRAAYILNFSGPNKSVTTPL